MSPSGRPDPSGANVAKRQPVPRPRSIKALPDSAEGGTITIQRELNPVHAAMPDSAAMAKMVAKDKLERQKAKVRQLQRQRKTI